MRVLVCGGRYYGNMTKVRETLDALSPAPAFVIDGGCPSGADSMARAWASLRGVPSLTYPAKWAEDGRKAGPLRNAEMLNHGRPDLVIAFKGGRGTADMVRRARQRGVAVREIP